VDAERLLRLRASPECHEFRAWLRDSDGISDDAVEDLLAGLRDRLGSGTRSRSSCCAFVVSSGVGLATGDPTGTGVSVVDSFVIDRLLPRPGPLAWLALKYPSVFKGA